jgi:glycosyltransferase involved in cell wall biosynthesis
MHNLKLSIITVNLNNKLGLQKTIESVVNQTFSEYEYIIIDGGSTDGSVEIIKEFADKITYWVSEPDKGIYNAMNKGIKVAKGEYCLFLNSGDWFVNSSLIKDIFNGLPVCDIVYGNMIKVFPDGKLEIDKGPQRSLLSLGDMYFGTINHSSSFIRRSLFEKYGLYNEEYKIVSDWAFFLKVIGLKAVTVKYIDLDINFFDMTGISNSMKSIRYMERDVELNKVIPDNLRPDYEKMKGYLSEVKLYNRIKSQKLLWQFIRVYNKLFGRPLW